MELNQRLVFKSDSRHLSREADNKEHGAAEEDPVFDQQPFHS